MVTGSSDRIAFELNLFNGSIVNQLDDSDLQNDMNLTKLSHTTWLELRVHKYKGMNKYNKTESWAMKHSEIKDYGKAPDRDLVTIDSTLVRLNRDMSIDWTVDIGKPIFKVMKVDHSTQLG